MVFKELPTDEISQIKTVTLQGDHGFFSVGRAGGRPGLEYCFYYKDSNHQFFFYAELIKEKNEKHALNIYEASPHRLRGILQKILPLDAEIIEYNIRLLFKTRRFLILEREISPEKSPTNIQFTWRISK